MSTEGSSDPKKHVVHQSGTRTKGTKRKQPLIYNGEGASSSTIANLSLSCPICCNLLESAYMTDCGHSFCQSCIQTSLDKQSNCPICGTPTRAEKLVPNFTLNAVVLQQKNQRARSLKGNQKNHLVENITELISGFDRNTNMSYEMMTSLIDVLQQKRQFLMIESEIGQNSLTLEFLKQIKAKKEEDLALLQQQLSVINQDLDSVTQKTQELEGTFNRQWANTSLAKICPSSESLSPCMRQRIIAHSSDLHDFYFNTRGHGRDVTDSESLEGFSSALSKFLKYKEFRQLASLNYTADMYNMYSIVSSIEFDKDADFFAIAGVTKIIKVFDYKQVITDVVDVHYPITDMTCGSKISCIAWNPYHKNELVSSDYEGTVSIWDPFTTKKLQAFQEHEKRCWCVDYNKMNPQLLASGSDDSKVKVWSTKQPRSILNIEALANVCCVKFNPTSQYHLAFGAADHCVHYYDLRKHNEALLTFKGHSKAVSYAKFLNGLELVSASTDSQLKLWNVKEGTSAVRTFQGHTNEKNFVGLASDSDFIACGSEDNSLCIYYKGSSKMLHKYKFNVNRSAWLRDTPREDDSNEFVSAVTWMPGSSIIVVANSQGIVKILELT